MSNSQEGKCYIGTSGWAYEGWSGVFYPTDISAREKLKYFSQFFKTAEVNYSFYHLPRPTTYQNWYQQTPLDFVFSLKVSRFITHIKRLKEVEPAWSLFLKNALVLKNKLGPFLFQFPASFKKNKENSERLKNFLSLARRNKSKKKNPVLRFAFEFRHISWFNEETYDFLHQHKAGWVIADSSRYPRANIVTSDFAYFRFHGPTSLFSSEYSKDQLREEAFLIIKYLRKNIDVFCYFNNDFRGLAVKNARELLDFVRE